MTRPPRRRRPALSRGLIAWVSAGAAMLAQPAFAQPQPAPPQQQQPSNVMPPPSAGQPTTPTRADGPAAAQPAQPSQPGQPAQPAQPAQAGQLPPGHPPLGGGDPHAGITMGSDPHGGGAPGDQVQQQGFARRGLPEEGASEAPDLPPGVVLVRVVDGNGDPVPDVLVRMGVLRDGESQTPREARTGASGANLGVAQFEGLPHGSGIAFRARVENEGARFSSPPFVLTPRAGARVQLIRHAVEHQPRALLISDARVEIGFNDDRIVVVERVSVVNFSAISLAGDEPRPYAYVPPPEGLRFRLPAGYSAFRTDEQQTMGDQSLVEENGHAVFRGSIPPTSNPREPMQLVFQYRVKIESTDIHLDLSLPLPALRALVVTQAPAGMRLTVEGMEPGQERTHNNQRILVTARERTSRDDPSLERLSIHLAGIPPYAGPERILALLLTLGLVAGSIVFAVGRARQNAGRKGRSREAIAQLEAERDRILADAADLARAHAAGEVGPETYDRRRRELTLALASVLRDLTEVQTEPPRKARTRSGTADAAA